MIEEITREQWDALTRAEQIEFVVVAFLASDSLQELGTKIPPWTPALFVTEAMQIGVDRLEAKVKQADAEYLSVADPEGNA